MNSNRLGSRQLNHFYSFAAVDNSYCLGCCSNSRSRVSSCYEKEKK